MLYVIDGAAPVPLPFRYTRLDGYTATAEAVLPAMLADGVAVVEVPDPPAAPEGQVAVWDGSGWGLAPAPPPPVPPVVSPAQARIALIRAGLMQQVQQTLDAMPGAEGEEARARWEYGLALERNHPTTLALAEAIGLTQTQVDDLFRAAAAIQ